MTDRELLEQALDYIVLPRTSAYIDGMKALKKQIEERLSEDDDKPVAWLHEDGTSAFVAPNKLPTRLGSRLYSTPLYRRQQPKARLTDDDIYQAYREDAKGSYYDLARAIENKIWEKNR